MITAVLLPPVFGVAAQLVEPVLVVALGVLDQRHAGGEKPLLVPVSNWER